MACDIGWRATELRITIDRRQNAMNQYVPEGFFKSLFDFSFSHFVVTKMIKVLYGLAIIVAGILALIALISGLGAAVAAFHGYSSSPGLGVLAVIGGLIGAPLVFLLAVVCARVYLELLIVVFRICEHVAEIASRGDQGGGSS